MYKVHVYRKPTCTGTATGAEPRSQSSRNSRGHPIFRHLRCVNTTTLSRLREVKLVIKRMNTRDHILQLCERGDVDELRKYTPEIITMDRHARVIAELSEKLSTPSLTLSATQSPECTAVQSARGQKSIRVVEFLQQIEDTTWTRASFHGSAATVEDIEFLDGSARTTCVLTTGVFCTMRAISTRR